jgi:O-antigen/teichoic acid export membrane protein
MAETGPTAMPPAMLMVGSRLVNMALGLLMIPVLIRYLGGTGFAAWAIYLAMAAAFSMLEIGMSQTSIRFMALAERGPAEGTSRQVLGRIWLLLALSFSAGLIAVLAFGNAVVAWLGLPDSPLLSAADSILCVFGAVALRSFLHSGVWTLFAARRFKAASAVALLQPLCSNLAAMVVAWQYGRLDLALLAFWSMQLGVAGATFVLACPMCMPKFTPKTFDVRRLRELGYYGMSNQLEGWAQFVNLQFDKFIIAGLVGLWGVAPYEVASRAVAALRSIPASGADTFLPLAMSRQASKADAWSWYIESTRLAAYGVCAFVLAPLAIAPLFLYAWTGEMGYSGRWVFVALAIGAAASVLCLPAATLAQAEGRPALQARAAAVAILVNAPLSLVLIYHWGLIGGAAGTGVAMVCGAGQLIYAVHRLFNRSLGSTLKVLGRFWPAVLVCLCWGVPTYLLFGSWFATLDPATRFSRVMRTYPGLLAIAVYVACATSLFVMELYLNRFTTQERATLRGLLRVRLSSASHGK